MEFQKVRHNRGSPSIATPSGTPTRRDYAPSAASKQASGYARIKALRRSYSQNNAATEPSPSSHAPSQSAAALTSEQIEAQDREIVADEYNRWVAAGVITSDAELLRFDLVDSWSVNYHLCSLCNHKANSTTSLVATREPATVPPSLSCCSRRHAGSSFSCAL